MGLGVALGWGALPLLVKLARRSRQGTPAEQYRALVLSLVVAAMLVFAPLARGWAGTGVELAALGPSASSSVVFVAELVSPLLGAVENAGASTPLAYLLPFIGGLWLLLFTAGVLASICGHVRLRRAYAGAGPAPARVIERAARIAAELAVPPPPIHVDSGLAAAFTYGGFSPVIVLGAASCQMPDADLDFVLRHELCHVARRDTRAILWIDLAQRLFTGHPSLRALAAEIRFAREACVDQVAAGARPLEYARFLLTVAEHVHAGRAPAPSLVSMADTALERRVEMLIKPNTARSRVGRTSIWLGTAGLALGGLVFAAPMSWAQPAGGSGRPTVSGNLSVEQVEQAMFADPGPMLACYGRLPSPRSTLFAHLSFDIAENGRVSSSRVSVPSHPELEPCLQSVLMNEQFPAPAGGTVHVELPTKLSPPYDERRAVDEARESTSQRLPPEVIRATVRSYYGGFRDCYEAQLPELASARVTLRFTIGRDGSVTDGEAVDETEAESERSAELSRCLDGVMRTMRFPAPRDGIVTVGYPIFFERGAPPPAEP